MFSFLVSKKNRAAIYQDFTSRYIMMIICNGPSLPFAMSALLGLFAFDKSLVDSEACLENILVNCCERIFDINSDVHRSMNMQSALKKSLVLL